MRITAGGNVGIGTTSPGQKLHVVGEGKIQGNLMVGSSGDVAGAAGQLHIKGPNAQVIVLEDTDNANLVVRLSAEETVGFKIEDTTNSNVLFFGDENGNVGIGTTSPGYKLQINDGNVAITGGTSSTLFMNTNTNQLYGDANGVVILKANDNLRLHTNSAERVRIISNGNVGIGTTAPANRLDVVGNASVSSLRVGSSASGEGIIRYNPGVGNGIGIVTGALSSSGIGLFVSHQNNNRNVGIGTTSPGAKLHVVGSTAATNETVLILEGKANGVGEYTELLFRNTWGTNEDSYIRQVVGANTASQDITIGSNDLSTVNEIIRFQGLTGNVGIGTISPTSKLEVAGGDIELSDVAGGITMISPDGTRYRITVANGGTLTVTAV